MACIAIASAAASIAIAASAAEVKAPAGSPAAVSSPVASPEVAADAAPAPAAADPEAEVRGMVAQVGRAEAEVRESLARFDGWLEQGRAQFSGADGVPDWRWQLLQRVVARVRTLMDPAPLATLQQDALASLERGEVEAARAQIVSTMRPFLDRGEEASTLMNYVPRRVATELAIARLRALLRGNGIDSPQLPRIEQLQALLQARESRDDFAMAAEIELNDLEGLVRQAYDAGFQAALAAARARPEGALALQPRGVRCPLASDTHEPGDAPRLDTTLSAPTRDYYPRDALEQEIEGKVALSARIDPQGCVRAAAVLVSSGVPALDEAALRWVLEGAVYTRSKPRPGGQPASASLSVNFKASD